MYTFAMQKSLHSPRWWDWSAVFLLFIILQIVAGRLIVTEWTPFLYLVRVITYVGCFIGIAIGYTRFQPGTARILSFLYMLIVLPLQWIKMIDQQTSLEEQLVSVGGRLSVSLGNFFAQRPVEDPLFFVAIMSIAFWVISSWAGFALIRNQNYLGAVLPSTVGLLVIQSYDNAVAGRLWLLGLFIFITLLLLGRLYYLQNIKSWERRRVFLSPDSRTDLTGSMALIAGALILISWSVPASVSSMRSAAQKWNQVTKPWREFTQDINNAFDALKSTGPGRPVDFFSSELQLGTGFSLSDVVVFNVQVPEIPDEDNPPRFYWQGRVYDFYQDGQWYTTKTSRRDFIPSSDSLVVSDTSGQARYRFIFFTDNNPLALLYAPAQAIWVSRTSSLMLTTNEAGDDLSAWFASPKLEAGESYQVEAALNNPDVEQLRNAGTDYPIWIAERYLQEPGNLSDRIHELAVQVTQGTQTPYDQAVLITRYLREQIEYSDSVELAPKNTDPLEWILFEYKKGYCVYYATSEVMMLRSLGIPARLAVGFAEGEFSTDTNRYVVRKLDAHAWPEVYFPNVGWVEFEPTGNQPELNRPLPENPNDPNASNNLLNIDDLEKNNPTLPEKQLVEDTVTSDQTTNVPVNPSLYLIPLFIIFATLTIYFSRRHSIPARIPGFLRTTIERSGSQAPDWIIHWEYWVSLSPIERSFESINFGIRLLEKPMPVHATPVERAVKLSILLPKIEKTVKNLLDEHQTSLYTSREADVAQARRAAFNIRIQVLIEKVRTIIEGAPARTT